MIVQLEGCALLAVAQHEDLLGFALVARLLVPMHIIQDVTRSLQLLLHLHDVGVSQVADRVVARVHPRGTETAFLRPLVGFLEFSEPREALLAAAADASELRHAMTGIDHLVGGAVGFADAHGQPFFVVEEELQQHRVTQFQLRHFENLLGFGL